MVDAVKLAIEGGATIIQIREKDISTAEYIQIATDVIAVARPRGVPVVINDRVDVALASGADGLHVGQDDMPAAVARSLIGPHRILGVSVKTVEEALKAQADGADYVGCGAGDRPVDCVSSHEALTALRGVL